MDALDAPALMQEERQYAHSTATSIIVGLIAAKLDEHHPGVRNEMMEQLAGVIALASEGPSNQPVVLQEIASFARAMLKGFDPSAT